MVSYDYSTSIPVHPQASECAELDSRRRAAHEVRMAALRAEIREPGAGEVPIHVLAARFGVTHTTVRNERRRMAAEREEVAALA